MEIPIRKAVIDDAPGIAKLLQGIGWFEAFSSREFKDSVVSEIPFVFFVWTSLLLARRYTLRMEAEGREPIAPWLVVGLFIYFLYGKNHSRLQQERSGAAPPSGG
jgi:hypothetical protein